MTDPLLIRVGDAERAAASDLLSDALVGGFISSDEFDGRLAQVSSAPMRGDLGAVFRDLHGLAGVTDFLASLAGSATTQRPPTWQLSIAHFQQTSPREYLAEDLRRVAAVNQLLPALVPATREDYLRWLAGYVRHGGDREAPFVSPHPFEPGRVEPDRVSGWFRAVRHFTVPPRLNGFSFSASILVPWTVLGRVTDDIWTVAHMKGYRFIGHRPAYYSDVTAVDVARWQQDHPPLSARLAGLARAHDGRRSLTQGPPARRG